MSDELHRFPPLVASEADRLRAELAAERERADKAVAERDEHRRRVEQAEALLFEASWALDEGSDLQERLDAYCIEHGLGWRP